jgi:hypothetical protein
MALSSAEHLIPIYTRSPAAFMFAVVRARSPLGTQRCRVVASASRRSASSPHTADFSLTCCAMQWTATTRVAVHRCLQPRWISSGLALRACSSRLGTWVPSRRRPRIETDRTLLGYGSLSLSHLSSTTLGAWTRRISCSRVRGSRARRSSLVSPCTRDRTPRWGCRHMLTI